jgi:hypothetical protein
MAVHAPSGSLKDDGYLSSICRARRAAGVFARQPDQGGELRRPSSGSDTGGPIPKTNHGLKMIQCRLASTGRVKPTGSGANPGLESHQGSARMAGGRRVALRGRGSDRLSVTRRTTAAGASGSRTDADGQGRREAGSTGRGSERTLAKAARISLNTACAWIRQRETDAREVAAALSVLH